MCVCVCVCVCVCGMEWRGGDGEVCVEIYLMTVTSLRVHFSHAVKSYCMQYPWNILLFYPLPHPVCPSVSSHQSILVNLYYRLQY